MANDGVSLDIASAPVGVSATVPFRRAADAVLFGLFAWWIGVAGPVVSGPSPLASCGFAALALLACVAGPLVACRRPGLGRAVGIVGFAFAVAGAWISAPPGWLGRRVDPVLDAVAVVAFGSFAWGWGTLESARLGLRTAERQTTGAIGAIGATTRVIQASSIINDRAEMLLLGRLGLVVLAAVVLTSAGSFVAEHERAVFAETAAGAAALGLIVVAGRVIERSLGNRRESSGRAGRPDLPRRRIPWSAALCVALGVAAVALSLWLR